MPAPQAGQQQEVRGRILLVQEERFRVWTADGRGPLLTLAHNANASAEDLHRLHKTQAEVLVEYTGDPNLASGVAHSVRPAAGPGGGR